jgi:hypothetical protein
MYTSEKTKAVDEECKGMDNIPLDGSGVSTSWKLHATKASICAASLLLCFTIQPTLIHALEDIKVCIESVF